MPTTTSITTNYAGQFASKYISAALLSADTLDKGLIEILPNVNFKTTLQKVNTDDIVKDATCDFTATSTLTLTDRVLEVEPFQVNLQLCKKDYYDSWIGGQMGFSAYDSIPASFADFLIAHVAAKTAQKIEQNIWNGNAASAGEFSGLISLMTADSDVVDVTATTVTASNVITELGKVMDAIPAALYGKEDLTIYVPQNVAKAYVRALGGFGASGLGANGLDNKGTMWYGDQPLFFDGVRVAMVNGLPSNKMVAAQSSNLYFGTGLLNERNEVRVLDMADLDGSDNIRVILRFFAGVQYRLASDVVDVTATTVTAANVITELGKVMDAIPAALSGKEDMTIYVPQNVAKAYVRALGGFGTSGLGANGVDNKGTMWYGQGDLFFDGIRVAMVNGLPSNKMVAAQTSNLYFGTGLLNERNEVRVLDMADLDGSDNIRVILRFFAGVQYGIGSDVVLYS